MGWTQPPGAVLPLCSLQSRQLNGSKKNEQAFHRVSASESCLRMVVGENVVKANASHFLFKLGRD